MQTSISFDSVQNKPVHAVSCTFVQAGAAIGHGREGDADEHLIVITVSPKGQDTAQTVNIINARECLNFPNQYTVNHDSVHGEISLSYTDTDTLRTWTLQHLTSASAMVSRDALALSRPVIDVPIKIDKVATIRYGSTRYAVVLANGRDHQIMLDDGMPAADSLRKFAADLRAKALRYLAHADMADAAAPLL